MIHVTQASLKQITDVFNKRKKEIGLSNYSVGEIFDHGGMSNIYRIIDASGNTDYVLRVSEEHKSSYSSDIFNVREMEILRELKKNSQPHVVQYLDAFVVDMPGQPRYYCAVMKFLCTLKQYRVKGDGVEIAVRLGCDFLPLLQSFMEKEILHRDIKPENIFYDGDFRNDTGFLLGDFGIAKRDTDTSVTPTGTETTMAPEVRGMDRSLGKDRSYSDMYSLGIVMYRYLNQGVYPSNRERIDKMPPDKKPFPEPRYGSKRLKALVIKATSYDPRDRFDSPQDMLRELQQCDEYREYCQWDLAESDTTVSASVYTSEKIESLLLELEKKEKECTGFRADIERLKQQAAERESELISQIAAQRAETEQLKWKVSAREKTLKAQIVAQQEDIERLKLQAVERESELQSQIVAQKAEADQLRLQAAKRESELQSEIDMLKLKVALYGDDEEYNNEDDEAFDDADGKYDDADVEVIDDQEKVYDNQDEKATDDEDVEEDNDEETRAFSSTFNEEEIHSSKVIVKTHFQSESVSIGDHITLGNYKQGAKGEIQPIEWRVLDVKDGKALVISEKLIDYVPYNQSYKSVTWENCTLHKWMNNDFFKKAFSDFEKSKIVSVNNANPNNPDYGTAGGRSTDDKVFALSFEDAEKYFATEKDRIAYTTDYTHSKGYDYDDGSGCWWLRSPGFNSYRAACVDDFGLVGLKGIFVYGIDIAVRPAFWLNLE